MMDVQRIYTVKNRYESELLKKANVTGVAVGYKTTGGVKTKQISIVVFVRKKLPIKALKRRDVIPSTLENVPTDVVEAEFKIIARTDRIRPAQGGISVAHYNVTAGTITNIFRDYTKPDLPKTLVSNNHVIAHSDYGEKGDEILQPGPYNGGTSPADVIATLERFYSLHTTPCLIDGAVGTPVSQDDVTENHYDFGVLTSPPAIPALGMEIQKGGRTTGLTEAVISCIDATVIVTGYPFGNVTFKRQIVGESDTAWIGGGDSGSLAVSKQERKCLGVCFAATADGRLGVVNDYRIFSNLLQIGLPALVTLKVKDQDGKPVPLALVTLKEQEVSILTGEDGLGKFGNIPVGTSASFHITHPDYATAEPTFRVESEVETFEVTLSPKPPKPLSLSEQLAAISIQSSILISQVVIVYPILKESFSSLYEDLKRAVKI